MPVVSLSKDLQLRFRTQPQPRAHTATPPAAPAPAHPPPTPTHPLPTNSVARNSPVERSSIASPHTCRLRALTHSASQIIALLRAQRRIDRRSRRQHPRHLAPHDRLGQLRVFHLLAERNPVALAQQPLQIDPPPHDTERRTSAASSLCRAPSASVAARARQVSRPHRTAHRSRRSGRTSGNRDTAPLPQSTAASPASSRCFAHQIACRLSRHCGIAEYRRDSRGFVISRNRAATAKVCLKQLRPLLPAKQPVVQS